MPHNAFTSYTSTVTSRGATTQAVNVLYMLITDILSVGIMLLKFYLPFFFDDSAIVSDLTTYKSCRRLRIVLHCAWISPCIRMYAYKPGCSSSKETWPDPYPPPTSRSMMPRVLMMIGIIQSKL